MFELYAHEVLVQQASACSFMEFSILVQVSKQANAGRKGGCLAQGGLSAVAQSVSSQCVRQRELTKLAVGCLWLLQVELLYCKLQ